MTAENDTTAQTATRAEAVRRRRAELQLTQEDAAEKAGVAVTTWRMIEAGRTNSFRALTLVAVARALEWQPDHLLEPGGVQLQRPPAPSPLATSVDALSATDQLLVRALVDRLSEAQ
ncbi:MAG TPA: helix-turn-helix transcriptional regulator [Euzebya sp.]|nr:helix-turn-helix transcriptional regulator [Euzebya sp.]